MNKKFFSMLAALSLLAVSGLANATAYGVSVGWNTQEPQPIMDMMKTQKAEFAEYVREGFIRDMYIENSTVGGVELPIIKFVMDGNSEQDVRDKLGALPFQKRGLVVITDIRPLGEKWLNTEQTQRNFSLELTWKGGFDPLEMDMILSKDLQKVIELNNKGEVTSAYLDVQEFDNGLKKPIYHIALRAPNAESAREMAKQFEAVSKGYADVNLMYLGNQVSLSDIAAG
ncbi:hypothetical protein [Enterovibrio coralii]|uniref:Uncharacterized protein n=1 Tax=Enterovibrio coralii TaxID=294935 RepID=A0A135I811_9GAMM|nr:hypothetical protein [Enterovibrio coralii]KXF81590.1 hypothetical protein ATN88_02630 [Enterovibrio coralii]